MKYKNEGIYQKLSTRENKNFTACSFSIKLLRIGLYCLFCKASASYWILQSNDFFPPRSSIFLFTE